MKEMCWMGKRICLLIITWAFSLGSVYPADDSLSYRLNVYLFSEFMTKSLPGGQFYPTFLENFVPDSTCLLEESNGFSLIDTPRVYYEGDSFIHFNWFYDGLAINSGLNEGSPGVLLPLSAVSQYEIQGETPFNKDPGLNFVSASGSQTFSQVSFSTVFPDLGGYVPWSTFMLQPHASTPERNSLLYTPRRKIRSNYIFDYLGFKKFRSSSLSFSLTYFDIARQFNDFNVFNSVFEENGSLLLLHAKYEKELRDGHLTMIGIYNKIERDHFLAELGRYPQETEKKDRQSFFSGLKFVKKRFSLGLSWLHETEELSPQSLNFTKDLKDNDGEGIYPFEKMGTFSADALRLSLDFPVSLSDQRTGIDFFADLRSTWLKESEEASGFNPITFDRSAYRVILWQGGQDYRNSNLNLKMGAMVNSKLTDSLSVFAKFFLQYSALRFQNGDNNLGFLNLAYDVGVLLFKTPQILFSFGRTPYELKENLNFFLETQRPWGTIFSWDDLNHDLEYQAGEEKNTVGYTGSRFHSLDQELKAPAKQRYLLILTTPLSKKFNLTVKGLYKKIVNNFWVRFREDYGFYEQIGGSNLYFFDRPYKDYILSNSSFEKEPFYAQLFLQVSSRENTKWFFSFSFLAHIGMGTTAFGNGPGTNDIGVLNETQADPNTWMNGFGRLDGDRAYVGKMFFGFYLTKNLSLAANLKYRDGTPFAFINPVYRHDQWVFTYRTIKGENEKGRKGGPREDYLSDISLHLRYKFKLWGSEAEACLSFFNLMDLGSELSEYAFSPGPRLANELEIPRSVRLGFSIKL
jgi:hypothetical protein